MTATAAQSSPYLTFKEALAHSKIPRRKLKELLETGEIHSKKFGRKVVVAKRAIDEWMERVEA